MSARPKDIGTAAESAVVRYLQANGFPNAERRALRGAYDCGDVTGIPGVVIEVKGGAAAKRASDGQVTAWLEETDVERRNARADVGILVMQRPGIGVLNAGRWWAILPFDYAVSVATVTERRYWSHLSGPVRMHLAAAATLLRHGGHGTPLGGAA